MSHLYGCTKDNNPCDKKETCSRYINQDNDPHTTLWKYVCCNGELYREVINEDISENKETS